MSIIVTSIQHDFSGQVANITIRLSGDDLDRIIESIRCGEELNIQNGKPCPPIGKVKWKPLFINFTAIDKDGERRMGNTIFYDVCALDESIFNEIRQKIIADNNLENLFIHSFQRLEA